MHDDVEKILIGTPAIVDRVAALARQITHDYRDRELTLIAVLNGALIFVADLLRGIPLPLRLDCVSVASYHGGTESTGNVVFDQLSMPDVNGRHVLIVDDILDTGRTLHAICEKLRTVAQPASVKICVCIRKIKTRAEQIEADYIGFDIADEFVVGYGLDFQERYRNLPFVGVLKKELTRGQ